MGTVSGEDHWDPAIQKSRRFNCDTEPVSLFLDFGRARELDCDTNYRGVGDSIEVCVCVFALNVNKSGNPNRNLSLNHEKDCPTLEFLNLVLNMVLQHSEMWTPLDVRNLSLCLKHHPH